MATSLQANRKRSILENLERGVDDYARKPATKRRTLVINSNYQPVTTIPLARAITKVFKENAVIVLPPGEDNDVWRELTWEDWASLMPREGESVLQATSRVFKVPEIIKVSDFGDLPSRRVKLSRRAIYRRDDYTCQYCGRKAPNKIPLEDLTIDHVVPRCQGGKTTWTNAALACVDCNRKKDNRTPDEANMPLKRRPTMPDYDVLQGRMIRCDSWQHFLGDCYWEVPLDE